jgi:1,4-dihydroxy-2-naphthoate octaprenyltransferase
MPEMTMNSFSAPRRSVLPAWKTWFKAIRFFSFTTSTIPIVAATMLAWSEGHVSWVMFVLMLVASMFTHAACNLTNDYFDDRSGVDTKVSLGPSGVLQEGLLSHRELRIGIAVCFATALLLAIPVMLEAGIIVLWIALFSAAAAFFYTAGPYPLAYIALGEVTVFLAMGVGMVGGTFYVHTGSLSGSAVLLGMAIGSLAAAILHANNIRDIEGDRAMNKRTLANLFGMRFAFREYVALVALPFLCAGVMIALNNTLWPLVITGAVVPATVDLVRLLSRATTPAEHNGILRRTAGLHLRFGVLTSIGVLVSAILHG